MIQLHKLPPPEALVENAAKWTEEYLFIIRGDPVVPAVARHRYRHPEIKERLRQETHDKCAYCESYVQHVVAGDIDHILPKKHRPDLVVEWSNLTLACPHCNREKGDYYNVSEPLVHPYEDDPLCGIGFAGPMAIHLTMDAAFRTVSILKLNRPELLQRRAETLETVIKILALWRSQPEGATKELLAEELGRKAAPASEHSAAVHQFLMQHGFPLSA